MKNTGVVFAILLTVTVSVHGQSNNKPLYEKFYQQGRKAHERSDCTAALDKYEQAIREYENAKIYDDGYTKTKEHLKQCAMQVAKNTIKKILKPANEQYQHALESDPQNREAQIGLASLALMQGDFGEADRIRRALLAAGAIAAAEVVAAQIAEYREKAAAAFQSQ